MARGNATSVLRPTLLDRLLEPKGSPAHPAIGLRELKRAVARDLEWLLNTKTVLTRHPVIAQLPEARASILTYGIPDYTNASWRSPADARRICGEIAQAVRVFEPRLVPATVRVTVLPSQGVDDFSLRFRIEGTLHVEPITEPVYFDSSVEMGTGEFRVDGSL
jgi:type VI secretion system protein ImpF